MADKKANQGTTITPEARVANNIVRVSNEDGTAGNGLKIPLTDFSLRDIQTTRNTCIALLASSGAAITTGQGYVFDGVDGAIPTGISLIRIKGIDLTLGAKGFSTKAEAYVTLFGKWFDCDYNVVTNEIGGDYLLWAGTLSADGAGVITVNSTIMNNLPETPTIQNAGYTGITQLITVASLFDERKIVNTATQMDSGDYFFSGYQAVVFGKNSVRINLYTGAYGFGFIDGILDNTYIEFRQRF